jgi:hypothetical protein
MNRQNCLSIHTPPSHVLASATPWEDEGVQLSRTMRRN